MRLFGVDKIPTDPYFGVFCCPNADAGLNSCRLDGRGEGTAQIGVRESTRQRREPPIAAYNQDNATSVDIAVVIDM